MNKKDLMNKAKSIFPSINGVKPILKPREGSYSIGVDYRYQQSTPDKNGNARKFQLFKCTYYKNGDIRLDVLVQDGIAIQKDVLFFDVDRLISFIEYRQGNRVKELKLENNR